MIGLKVIIDGNDGLGKSTLAQSLTQLGFQVKDRGIPSLMTDDESVVCRDDEIYVILDAPIEISRTRLAQAGKNLNEKYHTIEDLTYYRQRFKDILSKLEPNVIVIDASESSENVLNSVLKALPIDIE